MCSSDLDPTAHAEILAIREASEKIGSTRLSCRLTLGVVYPRYSLSSSKRFFPIVQSNSTFIPGFYAHYKLNSLGESALETMEAIALKRGFILSGKRIDYQRCARTVMDEFRSGKTGRITLEKARTV